MLFSRARCIAICSCLLAVLLPWSHASSQGPGHDFSALEDSGALLSDKDDFATSDLLDRLLEVERSAIKRQIEQYKRKAVILRALLAHYNGDDKSGGDRNMSANVTSAQTEQIRRFAQLQQSRQRSYRQQQQHGAKQRFSDWFEFQSSYYPSTSPVDKIDGASQSPSEHLRIDLLSFRSNANPNGKKNQAAQQRGRKPGMLANGSGDSALSPLLQFLAAFDMEHGRIDLLHPTTKELVWQHWLFDHEPSSSCPITDFFFVSERMSYLATLRANGEVSFYKLRVLHNRRLLAGDHRVAGKFDPPMCMRSYDFLHKLRKNAMGMPLNLPWRTNAKFTTTTSTSPALNYLHVDFEVVFRTNSGSKSNSKSNFRNIRAEKIAIVTFYSHAYVITANSEGELSFFHGENGTFIKSIATEFKGKEGVSRSNITQFEVLTTGIVAFAVGNRIHFVNSVDQSLISGVTCEGSIDTITSIDSDPWRYSTIYAGTSSGRGLVFRLLNFDRFRRSNGIVPMKSDEYGNLVYDEESEPACVLVDQLLPRQKLRAIDQQQQNPSQGHHQTSVRAIPGYLVMTTNTDVVLFQTSYDGLPKYITEYSTFSASNSLQESSKIEQLIALSVARDPNTHPAALAVHVLERHSNSSMVRHRVDVYESLLPQPTSSLDLSWLRAPIMLLCAVGVMYWQQQHNNSNSLNESDIGPLGLSHRGKNVDFDISKFSKMAAARGHQR